MSRCVGLGYLGVAALLLLLAMLLFGCTPGPQAEGQLPTPRPGDRQWTLAVMSGGPGVWTACYKGDRLYLVDSYLHRESEWHLTSPKTLAVAAGACR